MNYSDSVITRYVLLETASNETGGGGGPLRSKVNFWALSYSGIVNLFSLL